MGAIIKGSAISSGSDSSIELAAMAGLQCIEKSGIDKSGVDLLINVGIYRDDNIMEPAIAPLIQQSMGLNLDPIEGLKNGTGMNSTFCFDINNSTCGFIYAAQVAGASLRTGAAKNALIVSSDIYPSRKPKPGFPVVNPIGAAVLLSCAGEEDRGFVKFMFRTTEDVYIGARGNGDITSFGTSGRESVDYHEEPDYTDRISDFASKAVNEYIGEGLIDPIQIKFLITTQQVKGFSKMIYDSTGLNGYTEIVDLFGRFGNTYTSALGFGYNFISENRIIQRNDHILFVSGGAGLTSACALYIA